MLQAATHRRWPVVLLFLTILLAGVQAVAQTEKLAADNAVRFEVGEITGVFIEGTTTDPARQEAVLPCSFLVYGDFAPPQVNTIQLKLTYDASALTYLEYSLDDFGAIAPQDVYWQGAADVDDATPGLLIVTLDQDVQPTQATAQEFIYLKFTPRCQAELATTPVEILFSYTESFIIDDTRYADPGDPERHGAVTVADYTGFLALNDYDPYDEEPPTLVLQGVVDAGATIDVPIVFSANANIVKILSVLEFDTEKLMPVSYQLGEVCQDWDWVTGTVPDTTNGVLPIVVMNYPTGPTDDETACPLVTVTFEVLGDWRGQSTEIGFYPEYTPRIGFGGSGPYCESVDPQFDLFGMTVIMEDYEAAVRTSFDDMIFPGSTGQALQATLQARTNYQIGSDYDTDTDDDAPIRFALDLAPDVTLTDVYQPDVNNPDPANPLDDFFFEAATTSAKSVLWDAELYMDWRSGLPNRRAPVADFTDLVRFEVTLDPVVQPATFDEYRVPIGYLCSYDGLPVRVRDAVTDSLETNCGDGLVFTDTPSVEYAVGELVCETRTSTKPAYVVQEYWVRTSFDLADFEVRVNKSGGHAIQSVQPAEGVAVQASGSDYVVFADGGDWVVGPHPTRRLLGTITYNPFPSTPVFDKAGEAEKDVGPPVRWCWKWTTISFDAGSALRDASGRTPFMYVATGNVGTRWDCSIVANPDPLPATKDGGVPAAMALRSNYPNPFNPQTMIRFDVPRAAHVTLEVIDVHGRRVTTLVDAVQPAGRHEVLWDGRDQAGRAVSSGVYFAVMKAEDFQQRNKMVLLK